MFTPKQLISTLLTSVLGLSGLLYEKDALAFCHTMTCSNSSCEKDPETGCVTSGKPVFWKSSCVSISLQEDGTQLLPMELVRPAILKSFSRWQFAKCAGGKNPNISFVPTDDVTCARTEYSKTGPNVNVIFFRDFDWPYKGIDGTLATTSVSFDSTTGEINDADMAINAAFNPLTLKEDSAKYDLESIVTHEAGHFIGINHSSVPGAIMELSYSPGDVHRDLSQDDIDVLCETYPPSRGAECLSEPKGGFKTDCPLPQTDPSGCSCTLGSPSSTFFPELSLLGIVFFFARRKKPSYVLKT